MDRLRHSKRVSAANALIEKERRREQRERFALAALNGAAAERERLTDLVNPRVGVVYPQGTPQNPILLVRIPEEPSTFCPGVVVPRVNGSFSIRAVPHMLEAHGVRIGWFSWDVE